MGLTLSLVVSLTALSRRKQGFDSPWERQAQNKRSLLNGYQKIWRRFCDAVPLRIRLARDLFGERALMGARLVKHRLVGIEFKPRMEMSFVRPSIVIRVWTPASVDAGVISGMAISTNRFQFASRLRVQSIPGPRQEKPSLTSKYSRLCGQSGRYLGRLVHSKGSSATASSASQASIS